MFTQATKPLRNSLKTMITDTEKTKQYYQALLERNSEYIGIFYVAVKTTQVFCIATCRARKPKFENVVFYDNFKSALEAGFRPCKICKPTENAYDAPEPVQRAMALARLKTKEKISDSQLKEQNIQPEFLRRWFKTHYGMTFQAYHRMYRINHALSELKSGKKSMPTAFDSGYDSLSGFGYTYKKLIGHSPKHNAAQRVILIDRLTTPLGPMFICATHSGICLLEFTDRRMLENEFKDIQQRLKSKIIAGENQHIQLAKKQLQAYFAGEQKQFSLALDTPGTEFQRAVWQNLSRIPYGSTRSYQQQAELLKKPTATRAVAAANGMNRIAIIIPCHRVIGKNGKLTGYGGGLERKKWLLAHEQAYTEFSLKS